MKYFLTWNSNNFQGNSISASHIIKYHTVLSSKYGFLLLKIDGILRPSINRQSRPFPDLTDIFHSCKVAWCTCLVHHNNRGSIQQLKSNLICLIYSDKYFTLISMHWIPNLSRFESYFLKYPVYSNILNGTPINMINTVNQLCRARNCCSMMIMACHIEIDYNAVSVVLDCGHYICNLQSSFSMEFLHFRDSILFHWTDICILDTTNWYRIHINTL